MCPHGMAVGIKIKCEFFCVEMITLFLAAMGIVSGNAKSILSNERGDVSPYADVSVEMLALFTS